LSHTRFSRNSLPDENGKKQSGDDRKPSNFLQGMRLYFNTRKDMLF